MPGLLALLLPVAVTVGSCQVMAGTGEQVFEGTVAPVDLGLTGPTYAVATPRGLLVRSGEAERTFPKAYTLEWLPGGRALIYDARGRVRLWQPETDVLGPVTKLGPGRTPIGPGDLKRSVTQVDVSLEPREGRNLLRAYDLDLTPRWESRLPGPDDADPNAGSGSGFVRGYQQGQTIDGITYLQWDDYDPNGEESEPHYGLLRVDADGGAIGQAQVNGRITSTWLSADGSALLALRRPSGDPCGGCEVAEELVELDPATGEVAAEYGMPEEYDETWSVAEIDKVGDRVAVRFEGYPEDEPPYTRLRGTWVRDDDGWSMLPGSEEEITWWQGQDDKIVARLDPAMRDREGHPFRLFWVHGDREESVPGRLELDTARRSVFGGVPGQALPPG
ncbi:hypothetical protein [Nocardioides insulae]|uniref:hypothetical protein n=1 Tax=Nocardioides insulae TaxID=394734 RepID=UPI00041D337C|nr:hypothetical protein [Nocardioides insulae]